MRFGPDVASAVNRVLPRFECPLTIEIWSEHFAIELDCCTFAMTASKDRPGGICHGFRNRIELEERRMVWILDSLEHDRIYRQKTVEKLEQSNQMLIV